ncbi:hypothetical protein [Labrenzia sp. PHM005]|uniref:hypothetical protein n=1 Tax=Labrenzia sp. PHM005 TaxID=2590016 RepID=UPI00113FFB46|nr:hypothetical protein [Labrenzia sp. PHM005]QDG77372.1 hypothetical protein FJ695_16665 [Labrenzia sp. PHM005]
MFPQAVFAPIGQVSGPVITQAMPRGEDAFLFDLEALLSNTLSHMDYSFADYLREFLDERKCYLLSRNSFNDACSRLPSSVLRRFAGVFASCGTELWVDQQLVDCHDHAFSDDLYEFVVNVVRKSAFYERTPPLIDQGAACLRICLAGVRASAAERRKYELWEKKAQELPEIVREFQFRFPKYAIYQDTATSLLILPDSFSLVSIRKQIETHQKPARLISYLHVNTAKGFAKPLCDALPRTDVLSKIAGPSDVSQLLSYEVRRMSGRDPLIRLPENAREEA